MEPMDRSHIDALEMSEKWTLTFPREDWVKTPHTVQLYILALEHKIVEQQKVIDALIKRVDELETRLNRNSSNSNQQPSMDSPFEKKGEKSRTGEAGGNKGHKGHQQIMLEPRKTEHLKPDWCACGNKDFSDTTLHYTYQYIILPDIKMEVTHFFFYRDVCSCCGNISKASLPREYRIGCGPRPSATIERMAEAKATAAPSFRSSALRSWESP
jgi:transposase